MIVSIMQPTYIPWVGYFNLIKNSDIFIFLDDVQFSKRSWQQRNKILNDKNIITLTVPVFSKNKFLQNINQTRINNCDNWKKKHLSSIRFNYAKHNYFEEFYELYKNTLLKNYEFLSELNISLIKTITNYLNINCTFENSSRLNINQTKENKIIGILEKLSATEYISPSGSIAYLGDGEKILQSGFEFKYQNYKIKEYSQKNCKSFTPNLSIIDMIFNHGKDTILFI
jgi:hypothetical protein